MDDRIKFHIASVIKAHDGHKVNNRQAFFLALLEDRRYWWHSGVDPYALFRALIQLTFLGKRSGASTIEMQLVRTISNDRDNSLKRKIREMRRALWVGANFSKEEILATYWSICFKGDASKSNVNYLQLQEQRSPPIEYDAYIASAVRHPIPRNVSNTWQQKIVGRTLYARTLLHLLEKGLRIGSLIVAIDRAGLHIFSARLRSLIDNVYEDANDDCAEAKTGSSASCKASRMK